MKMAYQDIQVKCKSQILHLDLAINHNAPSNNGIVMSDKDDKQKPKVRAEFQNTKKELEDEDDASISDVSESLNNSSDLSVVDSDDE